MSAAVATDLTQLERRAQAVDLAKTGQPYRAIGAALGVNASTVARDIAAWAAETKPSVEATEELRKLQLEEINGLAVKLWAKLDGEDYLSVVDRLVKLMERKARLMGLDMPTQVQVGLNLPTAEALAELFGQVDANAGAIEGTAVEITDGVPPEGHS